MTGLHVTTLGCKLNQHDSAELAGALGGAAPLVEDPAAANVIVVNTCTVTQAADADARQILRRRRRESPRALIVATGCYAERDPGALQAMPEVDLVLTRGDRPRAARLILEALRDRFPGEAADGCAERVVEDALPDFGERTRAYLRVQEGCDLRCSYCVIPSVRGASRSLPPARAVAGLQRLLRAGYREVVLTGVNTGDYGKDLAPRSTLASLLAAMLGLEGDHRLRLNSVEPLCVTDELASLLAGEQRMARHLQIPLQSGSDRILAGMRRNYRTRRYAAVLDGLKSRMPDIGLGADVIVGFPGETDRDVERTIRFIRSTPLSYLHVFSYSSRPGTDAGRRADRVEPAAVRARSAALRELGRELSLAFRRSQTGRPLRALVLEGRRRDGRRRALTSNFIEAALEADIPPNTFADIVLTRADEQETLAVQA